MNQIPVTIPRGEDRKALELEPEDAGRGTQFTEERSEKDWWMAEMSRNSVLDPNINIKSHIILNNAFLAFCTYYWPQFTNLCVISI